MLELLLVSGFLGGLAFLGALVPVALKARDLTLLRREKEYVLSDAIQLLAIHRQRLH